jgi:hypothetical protein
MITCISNNAGYADHRPIGQFNLADIADQTDPEPKIKQNSKLVTNQYLQEMMENLTVAIQGATEACVPTRTYLQKIRTVVRNTRLSQAKKLRQKAHAENTK